MSDAKPWSEEQIQEFRWVVGSGRSVVYTTGDVSAWLSTVDSLRAEVERLRSGLHDAEAIGDFATELRDRLALKENAEACAKLAAEAVSERDALNAEIGRWRALHENAEWKGAAYLDALREAYRSMNPAGSPPGPDFLEWVADRLVHQYHEHKNVDFVLALRQKAQEQRAALVKIEASLEGKS